MRRRVCRWLEEEVKDSDVGSGGCAEEDLGGLA